MNDRTAGCTSPNGLMLYFLAGGVAGAGLALLLAPQSGRATRETIRHRMNDSAGSARDLRNRMICRARTVQAEARDRVDDAVSALTGDGGAKLPG